jgi:hypothetical protein
MHKVYSFGYSAQKAVSGLKSDDHSSIDRVLDQPISIMKDEGWKTPFNAGCVHASQPPPNHYIHASNR